MMDCASLTHPTFFPLTLTLSQRERGSYKGGRNDGLRFANPSYLSFLILDSRFRGNDIQEKTGMTSKRKRE